MLQKFADLPPGLEPSHSEAIINKDDPNQQAARQAAQSALPVADDSDDRNWRTRAPLPPAADGAAPPERELIRGPPAANGAPERPSPAGPRPTDSQQQQVGRWDWSEAHRDAMSSYYITASVDIAARVVGVTKRWQHNQRCFCHPAEWTHGRRSAQERLNVTAAVCIGCGQEGVDARHHVCSRRRSGERMSAQASHSSTYTHAAVVLSPLPAEYLEVC